MLKKGSELISKGSPEKAIKNFEKILKVYPNEKAALQGMAIALINLEKYEKALENVNAVLRINSKNEMAVRLKQEIQNKLDSKSQQDGRTSAFVRINISLGKDYDRAIELGEKGRFLEAINHFDKELEKNPNNPTVLHGKGTALYFLSRYRDAKECFTRAIEGNPDDLESMNYLASVLVSLKEFEDALSLLNQILSLDPNNPQAAYNKTRTLYSLGSYQEALNSINKVLEMMPGMQQARDMKQKILKKI